MIFENEEITIDNHTELKEDILTIEDYLLLREDQKSTYLKLITSLDKEITNKKKYQSEYEQNLEALATAVDLSLKYDLNFRVPNVFFYSSVVICFCLLFYAIFTLLRG